MAYSRDSSAKKEIPLTPRERKRLQEDIDVREGLARRFIQQGRFGLARGNYERAVELYEQMNDPDGAKRVRALMLNMGKGIRPYASAREPKVYDLDSYMEQVKAAVSAFAVFLGMFFISPSLTGNVIGDAGSGTGWIGAVILLIGVLGFYGYASRRKNAKK